MLEDTEMRFFIFLLTSAGLCAQEQPVLLKASTMLDGKGGVRHNVTVVVEGGTIRSVGTPIDRDVREAINRSVLPGPRVLTPVRQITDTRLTPRQLRELVRQTKADGADLIKLFASKNFRDGGAQTMSDEQILAVCQEARAQGLRVLVHVDSKVPHSCPRVFMVSAAYNRSASPPQDNPPPKATRMATSPGLVFPDVINSSKAISTDAAAVLP